jgi:hypothetical protein
MDTTLHSDDANENCQCENCEYIIRYNKDSIFILTKDADADADAEAEAESEELVLCQSCFDDLWKELYDIGWRGDDIEYYLEMEKESETESNQA